MSGENYFIHSGYQCRAEEAYWDDTSWRDREFSQIKIYEHAKNICDREKLASVVDLGCGSGCKLMRFFGHLATVGVDVPKTSEWLRKKYPGRVWRDVDSDLGCGPVDLVISADVIEHVLNPDELLEKIKKLQPRFVVLSTPDRDHLETELAWQGHSHNGPPINVHHIREWGFAEFGNYIGSHFEILEHLSLSPAQCVVCRAQVDRGGFEARRVGNNYP